MGRKFEPDIDYEKYFLEILDIYAKRNIHLLDLGTGRGKVIFDGDLSSVCKSVIGVDINPGYIKECKNKAKNLDNVNFIVADTTKKLGFPDESFNIITALFSPFNLKEVQRLLSGGGVFISMFSLENDHKEIKSVLPELFKEDTYYTLSPVVGKKLLPLFNQKEVSGINLVPVFKLSLEYKWIFSDLVSIKKFYEKILETKISKEKLKLLKKREDNKIYITRRIGLIVLKK